MLNLPLRTRRKESALGRVEFFLLAIKLDCANHPPTTTMDTRVILLAEDDDDDVLLIEFAFKEAQIPNRLQVVRDGVEAISYLEGEGQYANRAEYPLPTLLLLDIKMPRKTGFEVLQWIRSQQTLRALRVIVLTTCTEPAKAREAYKLGANAFLVKPAEFRSLVDLFKSLNSYWLRFDRSPDIARPEDIIRHRISQSPALGSEGSAQSPCRSQPTLGPA